MYSFHSVSIDNTGSPRFKRTRYTLFRLYAIFLQRSIFTQVAVLQGGVCKMGDRSIICVFTLKDIAVLHACIHTKTAEFHLKKGLYLRDFGIRERIYRVEQGLPVFAYGYVKYR
jgi:hypothetical protein